MDDLWRFANACKVWGDSVGAGLPAHPDSQHPAPAAIFAWEKRVRRWADLGSLSQDSGHTDVQPKIAQGPLDHAGAEIEPACVDRPGGNRGVRETPVGMRKTKLKYGRAVQRV